MIIFNLNKISHFFILRRKDEYNIYTNDSINNWVTYVIV